MKKIYLFSTIMLFGAVTIAQTTEGFEGFTLAPESYDNGSTGAGDFVFTDLTLTNLYNSSWDSWSGFSISNVTDNTTAGVGNQYASFTAGGYNSENFAVFNYDGVITASTQGVTIDSLKITNATFAAISMRDGDSFGKQFGSVNGADGYPDGTSGEDFFLIWAIGENGNGSQKDSVQLYLADYRFADNTEDYILDTWGTLDFSNFGFGVKKVSFRLESSDMNGAWLNTSTYFIIDNVSTNNSLFVQENTLSNVSVYPNPINDKLTVKAENGNLTITNVNGSIIYSSFHSGYSVIDVAHIKAGVYFVHLENENGSFTTKVIK